MGSGREDGWRGALRRHWKPAAAASALLVVTGLGVGWAIFGRDGLPPAIPADQQDALAAIVDDYDAGSVRFLGEEDEVGIWLATQKNGDLDCIIATHGDRQESGCQPADPEPAEGGPGMQMPSVSIEYEDDGRSVMVWATVMTDITGELVTLAQRQVTTGEYDWRQMYSAEEIELVEQLERSGFDPEGLYLAGYDGDTPVWQGYRDGENCLAAVIGTEVHLGCADANAQGDRLELRIGDTEYELMQTPTRGPMLSIIRYESAG